MTFTILSLGGHTSSGDAEHLTIGAVLGPDGDGSVLLFAARGVETERLRHQEAPVPPLRMP